MPNRSPHSGLARAFAVLCAVLVAGGVAFGVAMATASGGSGDDAAAKARAQQAQINAEHRLAHRQAVRRAKIRRASAAASREAAAKAEQARVAALRLQPGDKGPRVHELQGHLVDLKMLRSEQADGNYGDATAAAVMAFQKAAGLDRDGITGPKTLQAVQDGAVGAPSPFSDGNEDRVEVSLSKQLAQIVKGGRVQRVISISSGMPGRDTPTGHFAVYLKNPNAYSKKYDAPMPLASFFTGDYALHQSASVPGYPASHGCVRVPAAFAGEVYEFAGQGMPVVVVA